MVKEAKEFALVAHGNQMHGCLKMSDHLTTVTNKIEKEFPLIELPLFDIEYALAVGWLHDVLEDTDTSYSDIEDKFNSAVAKAVLAVTDGDGNTRTERHLNTYYRTRENQIAIFVKMADRWHNHQRSIDNNEIRFAKDYASEYLYFKFALYSPGTYDSFWSQLDKQAAKLNEMIKSV